jgi:N-acetylated-alpha-linked acidic dipeptidase
VLPISSADAQPLLEALGGAVAPISWRGGLPLTYHVGPGPSTVELELNFDWNITPIYNVLATLEGSEQPSQLVIRGNHHDAWVNGARDPISGLVALMAEARAVGTLVRSGWRPKRSLVFAAWDAEEPGLLGSTEWVEQHAERLGDQAVAYINTDSNGRGFLGMSGSHTLELFINEIARDVNDPQTGVSVFERLAARQRVNNPQSQFQLNGDHPIGALGSGSDYTPFLQHLGIASLNLGYSGESGGGSYHSIYDSFDHYLRFGDPGFAYGVALARTAGRAVLRLADADVLPFEFENFSETLSRYVNEIVLLADEARAQTEQTNQLLTSGDYALAADQTKTYVPPQPLDPVPHLNFAPLHNALTQLDRNAKAYNAAFTQPTLQRLSADDKQAIDSALIGTERALTRSNGLPGRPWFKHQIYAPGFYTGYGVKTIPGVREAIEQRNWTLASTQIALVADTVTTLAGQIGRATEILLAAR